MAENKININGVLVRLSRINENNYVSLTDLARNYGEPSFMIKNWIRTLDTIEYMGL